MNAEQLLGRGPVLPLVVLDDADRAVPLAAALLEGGLGTMEIALRTGAALDAIGAVAREVPEMVVGAGTVRSAGDVDAALAAGARFLVSPGQSPALLDAMSAAGVPFLAGCSGSSDLLALHERGITCAKLFPASVLGGAAMARALAGPFPEVQLCPSGGIDVDAARLLLDLPNVPCVGGSWITAGAEACGDDWSEVVGRARAARSLAPAAT
jgi:2-dehydro-3-deoxyphosphogluconate aldolase/(4S)-4-hydroxy-2-oxoglutarate aldolase